MKRYRFPTLKAVGPRGFSHWVQPQKINKHFLGCCDCGLVHEMQFRIIAKNGDFTMQFRARRARNYTAQLRRKQKKHQDK